TPGISVAQLAEAARACSGSARVSIISSRELYEASVAVFDRTFVITGVLRLLTVVVAVVGILSALMAMQVERARELAVLRAMGLTPAELWGVVCGETGLVGLTAGLLSLPPRLLQAAVRPFALNP
ncbi:MAG TPA: ABC transporter permease, partial [Geobacter anodireducens]|nr:ABC transporter permease [Geobacter anodireducens]